MIQSAIVLMFVGAISWSAVRVVDSYRESGVAAQRDAQQDRNIEELRAWRSVAEQALRDCRTRQAPSG